MEYGKNIWVIKMPTNGKGKAIKEKKAIPKEEYISGATISTSYGIKDEVPQRNKKVELKWKLIKLKHSFIRNWFKLGILICAIIFVIKY